MTIRELDQHVLGFAECFKNVCNFRQFILYFFPVSFSLFISFLCGFIKQAVAHVSSSGFRLHAKFVFGISLAVQE